MERFTVTYRVFAADAAEARARAEGIALEQTVEVPADVVPAGYIADEIVGQIEEIGQEGEGRFRAAISYSPDSAGHELTQFFNVIFGNSSIQKGLKVIGNPPPPWPAPMPKPGVNRSISLRWQAARKTSRPISALPKRLAQTGF
ncbi:MAG: hypothetical protein P8X51_06410 [Maritimibacter sp.]